MSRINEEALSSKGTAPQSSEQLIRQAICDDEETEVLSDGIFVISWYYQDCDYVRESLHRILTAYIAYAIYRTSSRDPLIHRNMYDVHYPQVARLWII